MSSKNLLDPKLHEESAPVFRQLGPRQIGTPKSLLEAVTFGMSQSHGREARVQFANIIKDFLAQKFQTAMFEHPECEAVLEDLFQKCSGEQNE